MIQLALFLSLAALLFLALIVLAARSPRAEGGAQALVEARQALSHLQAELLPSDLVARVFAREDLEYVLAQPSHRAHEMFLAERKKIAILWVRGIRRQVINLTRFHLGAARHYSSLSFRIEAALALDFAFLLFVCRALQVLIHIRGPYSAFGMVDATASAATRISSISEQALAFMNPAQMSAVSGPTGSSGGALGMRS